MNMHEDIEQDLVVGNKSHLGYAEDGLTLTYTFPTNLNIMCKVKNQVRFK